MNVSLCANLSNEAKWYEIVDIDSGLMPSESYKRRNMFLNIKLNGHWTSMIKFRIYSMQNSKSFFTFPIIFAIWYVLGHFGSLNIYFNKVRDIRESRQWKGIRQWTKSEVEEIRAELYYSDCINKRVHLLVQNLKQTKICRWTSERASQIRCPKAAKSNSTARVDTWR